MKKLPLILTIFFTLVIESNAQLPTEGTIYRVIDGDTYYLSNGMKLRLIGINTPEVQSSYRNAEFYGSQASMYARKWLLNRKVTIEYDRQYYDRYDRLLVYLYVGDTMVNQWLVQQGYANVMTIAPNTRYVNLFVASESYARKMLLGMWDPKKVLQWQERRK